MGGGQPRGLPDPDGAALRPVLDPVARQVQLRAVRLEHLRHRGVEQVRLGLEVVVDTLLPGPTARRQTPMARRQELKLAIGVSRGRTSQG